MKKIYLIRHLYTSLNKEGIYMGRHHDPDILDSERGAFINKLQSLNLESQVALYSSPRKRCLSTINIVKEQKALTSEIKIMQELDETDFGTFTGKNLNEIQLIDPKFYKTITEKPFEVEFPSGETYKEVNIRSIAFFENIINESGDTIVCTHVDIIKSIIFNILGIPFNNKKLLHIDSGSISLIEYDQISKLKFINL